MKTTNEIVTMAKEALEKLIEDKSHMFHAFNHDERNTYKIAFIQGYCYAHTQFKNQEK